MLQLCNPLLQCNLGPLALLQRCRCLAQRRAAHRQPRVALGQLNGMTLLELRLCTGVPCSRRRLGRSLAQRMQTAVRGAWSAL